MRGDIDFQKYSQFLSRGLFADNVILSIINYRENNCLDSQGKEALQKAKAFLDEVINGESLQNGILKSTDDVKAVKTFTSVSSINVNYPKAQSFIVFISKLRDTIEALLNQEKVTEKDIEQIDNFFSSYSRIHFQEAKSTLEAV